MVGTMDEDMPNCRHVVRGCPLDVGECPGLPWCPELVLVCPAEDQQQGS